MDTSAGARAISVIEIERPARYGKQLASHLGRKSGVDVTSNGWVLDIRDGRAEIIPGEHNLTLIASAQDRATCEIIQDVLSRHLQRFAPEVSLTIDWN